MDFRETGHADRKAAKRCSLSNQLDSVVKTVGMGAPILRALGRIAAQRKDIFNPFALEPVQDRARLVFGLSDHGQMTHDLQSVAVVDSFHQVDGFFARASASPVCNRTKARIEPLNDLYFAEEVFLAFFRLRRKELDRYAQAPPRIHAAHLPTLPSCLPS